MLSRTVIVGAGPVGLVAALALTQRGIEVVVLEAQKGIDPRMRASTFHPPTLDMLDELGLAAELVASGRRVRFWQYRQHETAAHATFDMATLADDTRFPFRLQLAQQALSELALAELDRLGVEVHFDVVVTDIEQDRRGAKAITAGGTTFSGDWLIGADGARSAVRRSLGLAYGGKTYTHSSVLVSTPFPFDEHLDALTDVAYCWSERGPFSLLRQRMLWRASLYPGVASLDAAADEPAVRAWLEFVAPDARDADISDITPYRVHERSVDTMRIGRILLAGDAAHINAPSGGMGMNGGIHDAVNLADKLAAVADGADDSLLDRYSRQRLHVARQAVIPRAAANRRHMLATNRNLQDERLERHRQIATDPERCRVFLKQASMLTSLEEADRVE